MNTRLICQTALLTLCGILYAGRSYAASPLAVNFVVSGDGAVFVSSEPFTDFYGFGPGVSFGIAYPVTPKWSFGLEFSTNLFAPDKGSVTEYLQSKRGASSVASVDDGSILAVSLDFSGRRYFAGPFQLIQPYIKAGYGLTHFTSGEINASYTTAQSSSLVTDRLGAPEVSDLSLFIGFGLERRSGSSKYTFYGEATYRVMLEKQDRVGLAGMRLGVKF